jgi:XTP/dITP diphosphohydrolase
MKEKRIVFATGNENKMREIRMILEGLGFPVISMREADAFTDVEENGESFEENAMIKAEAVSRFLPQDIVLADDSGLEIDYLDKAPGIYSARFAGVDTPYEVKNQMFLEKLQGVPAEKRSARFVCAVAAVFPDGSKKVLRETMEGQIAEEVAGKNGFGYDPIFYLPEYACTSAELDPEKKNEISHRGKAIRAMRAEIEKYIRMEK